MYGSPPPPPPTASARDLNRPFQPASMTTHQHQMGSSSGLLRYRSAPSSLLNELCEDFLPVRPPSTLDTDTMMFARFLSSDEHPPSSSAAAAAGGGAGGRRNHQLPPHPPPPPAVSAATAEAAGFPSSASAAAAASASQMMYQHQLHHQMLAMEEDDSKNAVGNCSNLVRQSSSPAGLFSHLNVEHGYGAMGSGIRRFKNERQLSSAGLMSQISDIDENESVGIGGFLMPSWEEEEEDDDQESSNLSDNSFSASARLNNKRPRRRDDNQTQITQPQSGERRNGLAHQFSLPKTSSEMAAIEKFMHFQDSVPCKIRAKRGCATHPRSIAERVRRTRISERMRKLQELVPNMDKQTNTSDMLDLAVDYIKDLQEEVKTLTNNRAKCICSSNSKQKQYSDFAM